MFRKTILSVLILFIFSTFTYAGDEPEGIEELRASIEKNGYSFQVGRTSVSGLSIEEKRLVAGFRAPPAEWWNSLPKLGYTGADISDPVFDWREQGGTTPVKDQGVCGSCWAFAAISQLESYILIYDGVEMDLSEQHVIDCNAAGKDCDGGNAWAAYDLLESFGSVTEACIPYTATDGGSCRQAFCEPVALIEGAFAIDNSVPAIKEALLNGPVYTAFKADETYFYNYSGGCYDVDNLYEVDHALVIVGWDDTVCDGGAWIVKNHWSEDWGIDGYAYIKYGVSWIGWYATQIIYPPMVELVSPNGGQTIYGGDSYTVRWNTGNVMPDSVSIFYSLGGGGPYDYPVALGLTGVNEYSWTVPDLEVENASMYIRAWLDGSLRGEDIGDGTFTIAMGSKARQNFPNPFNDATTISYSLSEPGKVKIVVYDISGGVVRVLEDRERDAGSYSIDWDGTGPDGEKLSSGVYFCYIEAGNTTETKKLVIVR